MHKSSFIPGFLTVVLLLYSSSVQAQKLAERPRTTASHSFAYNAAQETVVEGTVLSYAAEAAAPPIGAHVVLQTPTGSMDLHLGGASYLQANHFSLTKGDSVRVVGVNSVTRQGTVFLVRAIQKGGQSLALRTANGAPLSLAGARAMGSQKTAQPLQSQAGPR